MQFLAIPLVSLRIAPWLAPKAIDHLSPRNFGDTTLVTARGGASAHSDCVEKESRLSSRFRVTPAAPEASIVVIRPTSDHDQLSPTQQARLERLREPSSIIALNIRLADRIDEACDDVERVQLTAVTASDDEDMAWLLLCDRGWPRDRSVEGFDLTPSFAWLAAWSELVSLPVEIATPLDKSKLRWIEEKLTQCEQPLMVALPPDVQRVVGALDRTGRATLAWVLQALVIMVETRAHSAALRSRRDELIERFTMFRQQARQHGVRAPLAALDVRAWRAMSAAVRAIRD